MNKKLSACIDAHRTAIEMAAKTRSLPALADWLGEEFSHEIPDTCLDMETLSNALLQFYPH